MHIKIKSEAPFSRSIKVDRSIFYGRNSRNNELTGWHCSIKTSQRTKSTKRIVNSLQVLKMNIKKLLYESFDRKLTKNEEKKLLSALNKSVILSKEENEISSIRELIAGNMQRDFSPGFEIEVINRINSRITDGSSLYIFFSSMNTAFRKLAYATIIFIIITLTYNFSKSGNISLQSALGIKQQNSTSLADDFKNLFSFYE